MFQELIFSVVAQAGIELPSAPQSSELGRFCLWRNHLLVEFQRLGEVQPPREGLEPIKSLEKSQKNPYDFQRYTGYMDALYS